MSATLLPKPRLELTEFGSIPVLTDNALANSLGVRVAFTGRFGGVSEGAYENLNLGGHVGDNPQAVAENRALLMRAFGAADVPLVVPKQVHGTQVVEVLAADKACVAQAQDTAEAGADAVLVAPENVAALLCFADCVPVIVVSPSGRFAVVHAGWRGAAARIASKATRRLAQLDAGAEASEAELVAAAQNFNAYIGPCIHAECFETGADVHEQFVAEFGAACAPDETHVDLPFVVRADLEGAGVCAERIVDADICTSCNPHTHFSFRASGGTCGRHGALAFRAKGGRA